MALGCLSGANAKRYGRQWNIIVELSQLTNSSPVSDSTRHPNFGEAFRFWLKHGFISCCHYALEHGLSRTGRRGAWQDLGLSIEPCFNTYLHPAGRMLIDDDLGKSVLRRALRLLKTLSSGPIYQFLEDRLQFDLSFDRAGLTALKVDPAFVESIQHLYAGQWMVHSL